ncbi:MAG TPA: hypothetical protein VLT36_13000 [Candidatus Dormibacteraeota bacterium]|nr:hypothetical protein [Candidatus Dormibacteraeota bacterium]
MTKDITNVLYRVCYANGLFVAGTDTGLFTSSNGTNWVARNLPGSTNASFAQHVILAGSRFLAVGDQQTSPSPNSFAPSAWFSDPLASISIAAGSPPQLEVSGVLGRSYGIDAVNALQASNSWQTLTTLTLTNSPLAWTDTNATNVQRFYRAVLLP